MQWASSRASAIRMLTNREPLARKPIINQRKHFTINNLRDRIESWLDVQSKCRVLKPNQPGGALVWMIYDLPNKSAAHFTCTYLMQMLVNATTSSMTFSTFNFSMKAPHNNQSITSRGFPPTATQPDKAHGSLYNPSKTIRDNRSVKWIQAAWSSQCHRVPRPIECKQKEVSDDPGAHPP